MKFGDLLHGTITRFNEKGCGVFDAVKGDGGNRPIIVPFTTIGDEVECSFIKRQEGCLVANLVRIITPGPSRIQSPSPLTPRPSQLNPGMLWADITYDDQIKFKEAMINEALEKAGHDERVEKIIPCPPYEGIMPDTARPIPLFYRNRMDYAIGWKGEIGLKEYGSWNRYIDLKDCVLLSPDAPKILDIFRDFMKAHPELKPWDAKKQTGDLRYVVIREGKKTGERLIALIVKDLTHFNEATRKELVDRLDTYANNIVLAENPAVTDLSFGRTIEPLKGKETFDEIVNDTRYTIQLNSFFQTNPVMAGRLQDTVAEMISEDIGRRTLDRGSDPHKSQTTNHILDLYCGLGFFAINLAKRFPDIKASGYEIYEHMIELAKTNAEQNNVADRCEFTSGKAEDLSWKEIDADAIIVDPPRAGLHPRVIETLLEKEPQTLIYISCNYHRFVHELTKLKTKYDVKQIIALDLFPHTPHVEVVTKLKKR
jgi:tRNA (uracil-5-)-methyltransferase